MARWECVPLLPISSPNSCTGSGTSAGAKVNSDASQNACDWGYVAAKQGQTNIRRVTANLISKPLQIRHSLRPGWTVYVSRTILAFFILPIQSPQLLGPRSH